MASDLTTTFAIQIAELGNLRGCVDGAHALVRELRNFNE